MQNRIVPEIRYDLITDADRLDWYSHMALVTLAQKWSRANDALKEEPPFELAPYEELDGWPALINPNV